MDYANIIEITLPNGEAKKINVGKVPYTDNDDINRFIGEMYFQYLGQVPSMLFELDYRTLEWNITIGGYTQTLNHGLNVIKYSDRETLYIVWTNSGLPTGGVSQTAKPQVKYTSYLTFSPGIASYIYGQSNAPAYNSIPLTSGTKIEALVNISIHEEFYKPANSGAWSNYLVCEVVGNLEPDKTYKLRLMRQRSKHRECEYYPEETEYYKIKRHKKGWVAVDYRSANQTVNMEYTRYTNLEKYTTQFDIKDGKIVSELDGSFIVPTEIIEQFLWVYNDNPNLVKIPKGRREFKLIEPIDDKLFVQQTGAFGFALWEYNSSGTKAIKRVSNIYPFRIEIQPATFWKNKFRAFWACL